MNVQASKKTLFSENVPATDSSQPSAQKVSERPICDSQGHITNLTKLSNSVYATNKAKKQRNFSEFNAFPNKETQIKISQALKGNTMARNRTRIRHCRSLESSKFSSWSSYSKGRYL